MDRIIAPLKPGDSSPQVANLQEALLALLERQIIRPLDAPNRPSLEELQKLAEGLKREHEQSVFGKAEQQLISYFQIQQGLGDSLRGVVEEKTAAKLNEMLASINAFDGVVLPRLVIRGTVSYPDTSPAVGLTVVAFDNVDGRDNRLGDAMTDEVGGYTIAYGNPEIPRLPKERPGADVFVRVRGLNGDLPFQSKTVRDVRADLQLNVEIPARTFVVSGQVRFEAGAQFEGVEIRAYQHDLRDRRLVATAPLRRDGSYEMHYPPERFGATEKDGVDLIMEVVGPGEALLASSPVVLNAPPSAVINVSVPTPAREQATLFVRIGLALEPLIGKVKVAELDNQENQDLAFLTRETGLGRDVLARYILAHRLVEHGIQPEFWFAVLGSSPFDLNGDYRLADKVALVLDSLSSLDASGVRKAITRALNQKDIAEGLRANMGDWTKAFLSIAVKRSVSGEGKPTLVRSALDDAGIEGATRQEEFARLFNQHKALTPELLGELERDPSFKPAEVADLRTSFRLAELIQGDFSVVKMLKEEFDVRQPEGIRTLARKSEDEWVKVIKEQHAAGKITVPTEKGQAGPKEAETYGKTLARQFREAFPTAAFAGGLDRALKNGGTRGLRHAAAMNDLLSRHQDLELLNTNVDEFLDKRLDPALRALATDQEFRLEAKAAIRAFKLAPVFEATDTLLADGLHSAQQVYRMGESEFVRRYSASPGFTAETARHAWNRAADTHAAVLTIVADLKALHPEGSPLALPDNGVAISNFPNWDNLFKTGDLCECEHCRSVLSPAAYFADLLMFLRDRESKKARPAGNGHYSAKDILLGRRPDLGYLGLNCDNAQTPLPYIDVVCEVLEDVIAAGENDREVPGLTTMSPALAVLAATQAKFKTFLTFGSNGTGVSLSQVDPTDPNRWVLHGGDVTYLMKKKGTPNFFLELIRNTEGSAAELRAYPAYVNPKAYEKLRAAKYPRTLPFDLFAEEIRATLQKAGLQRWDLMRTLQGPAGPNNPTDGDIAAEYFGISISARPADPSEKQLILEADATPAGQQAVWDEAAIPGGLTNVKVFLQKTGLEYNELRALLDLKFINPTRDITVQSGASCDCDTQRINGLDDLTFALASLDRIHRFLRLWRKLKGWTMWELDLVLRQRGIGNQSAAHEWLLNEAFLVNLFQFSQVRKLLGGKTTVEQACALFGNLNTDTRFTKLQEKRADGLYQTLFLNKRLIYPLDAAFAVDRVNVSPPTVESIANHRPAMLAAMGIREAELLLLEGLSRDSTGTPYITGDLTLTNLSFLWRHAWLAKLLKVAVQDWATTLRLFNQDLMQFASPKAALEFLEGIQHIKSSGFTPDELNWLLTADRSAKAAVKEADCARFLTALRKDIQAIRAEYDFNAPQYAFLSPPRDVENLSTLLISLMQELNREEADANVLLKVLRGPVSLEADVRGLDPAFEFLPDVTGGTRHIPISHEHVLRFGGSMTPDQRTMLLSHPSLIAVTGLTSYQQAIQDLFQQSAQATVTGLPADFSFPPEITGGTNNIPISYESVFRFNGVMTDPQRSILRSGALPAAATGNPAYVHAIDDLFHQSQVAGQTYLSAEVGASLPAGGVTLPDEWPSLPIRYNATRQTLGFTGVMTDGERDALLAAGYPVGPIEELHGFPRMAGKFFELVFTAPLSALPPSIDFNAQLLPELAAKISYDAEQRLLRFAGFMSDANQTALRALVSNVLPSPSEIAYRAAVDSLKAQPRAIAQSDDRVWLTDDDIDTTQPANGSLTKRLANAAKKALGYLSKTRVAQAVVKQSSVSLGLTEALTRRLVDGYALVPTAGPQKATLQEHLTGAFANTTDVLDYATPAIKPAFDGWFWVNRAAELVKQWKISLAELDSLIAITARAQLLDFLTLPLDSAGQPASLTEFLRTSRLLRMSDSLAAGDITLLEVLENLNSGAYAGIAAVKVEGLPPAFTDFPPGITAGANPIPIQHKAGVFRFTGQMSLAQRSTLLTDPTLARVTGIATYRDAIEKLFRSNFAGDVERMNGAWLATEVVELVASLGIRYPTGYLLLENWERLLRAFSYLDNLNAGANLVKSFAAAAMTDHHATTLKELLRSKFGAEAWLAVSVEIQDALRERKRDALSAYLLTRPRPADAPGGKWEDTNDLYAYYLLDVEMCSCQLTSRLVQASGSVQLFVQRCFMGLEGPNVVVQADGPDGDSAWRWWKWMRKYQVWVANRKVFLWPENWIEPELKKDRSPFFKDLENELLQNEINQYSVEAAFSSYLEKLDGVAQLEIAGTFQEDDGDNAILHVFGRTAGAEPHLYYYRRYDYRQWTPWEKVDLDIQGDYLVPAVLNKRLYLFWPVFTEVADQAGNRRMNVPAPGQKGFTPDRTTKRLRLQMAVSDYRQGKWTPKKVSKDSTESEPYTVEILRQHYRFLLNDRNADGRCGIQYDGYSVGSAAAAREIGAALAAAAIAAGDEQADAQIIRNSAFNVLVATKPFFTAIQIASNRANYLVDLADSLYASNFGVGASSGAAEIFATIYRDKAQEAVDDANRAYQAMVPAALGSDDPAALDTSTLITSLQATRAAFEHVRWAAAPPGPYPPPQLIEPMNRAREAANKAADAGAEALRSVRSFRDTAASDLRSVEKDLTRAKNAKIEADKAVTDFYPDNSPHASLSGVFEVSGRTGVPENARFFRPFRPAIRPETASVGNSQTFLKWVELGTEQPRQDTPDDDFSVLKFLPRTPLDPPLPLSRSIVGEVLTRTPGTFTMSPSSHLSYFDELWSDGNVGVLLPYFYADKQRTFFAPSSIWSGNVFELSSVFGNAVCYYPEIKKAVAAVRQSPGISQSDLQTLLNKLITFQWFHFKNFYHPFVGDFARLVNNPLKGIPALMSRETQLKTSEFRFEEAYGPGEWVLAPLAEVYYPKEQVDFTPDGSYSPYNWELFFHAPLLIANSLSKNQRFEEAREWYHFIFNPIGMEATGSGGSPMSKYWITKPFAETTTDQYVEQRIDNIMRMLAGDTTLQGYSLTARKNLEDQVLDWRTNPFEPHRIANYRTVAYQKTVIMKYLDNLVAWGDSLFRQDSMESINEATQLYVLAAEIIGPRPKIVPSQTKSPVASFNELETAFDAFANALVQVENVVPALSGNRVDGGDQAPLPMLYFCIPQNDKMVRYWDTVADRLYKIRHCMDIEGVVRQLALFEPPIDPGALVKAVAGGADISAALTDLNAPLPLYRFNVVLQKANEICNDVKALGSGLLAALEKKDAEAISLLRQGQEIRLLEAVRIVRQRQIEEAKENLAGVKRSRDLTEIKRRYYESREFMNALESVSAGLAGGAIAVSGVLAFNEVLASTLFLLPSFNLGVSGAGGSPQVTLQWGSENIAKSVQSSNSALQHAGSILSQSASLVGSIANYERRKQDWDFQADLATKELDQIERQIASAELRIAIAEKELENHTLQIENAKATDEFMRSKYTNQELFQWQVGQISGVYFESYKLAFDLAKRAERCFRFELGLPESSYINFGYWDSLKKGLLSGEKLQYDLRRLETAYLEQNRREFELTKHVSVALLDPLALIKLRETGRCFLRLPEEMFDLDYPGHYFRRLKSVSLTLPCVVGPFTTISCTLRLLRNSVRLNTSNGENGYARNADENGLPADDDRFIESNIPVKAIAASSGQNDSGVFELSFRDERYLPFEGAGAVSEWALELFTDAPSNNEDPSHPDFGRSLRQFDYNTIADAVLHVKYTAREDGGAFKNGAITNLRSYFQQGGSTQSFRAFNLRQEFPTQWNRFLHPVNGSGNVLEVEMTSRLFPWRDAEKTLAVNTVWLLARSSNSGNYKVHLTVPLSAVADPDGLDIPLTPVNQYGGLHFNQTDVIGRDIAVSWTGTLVKWRLEMTGPGGNLKEEVEDLILILGYQWASI